MRRAGVFAAAFLLLAQLAACGAGANSWAPQEIRSDPEPVLHHFPSLPPPEQLLWGSGGSAEENRLDLCFFAFYEDAAALRRSVEDYGALEERAAPALRFVPEELEGQTLRWLRLDADDAFQEGVPAEQRFVVTIYVCLEPPVLYADGSLGG